MLRKVTHLRILAVGMAYAYQEERQPTGEIRRIFKPKIHPIAPHPVDILAKMKRSENKNLSIHGTSGSGKTVLAAYLSTQFPEYQRIIFCFKPNDYYLRFTNIKLDVSKYLPDPFANPYAFLGAFETAFSPDTVTLQTNEARNELPKVLLTVHNWDELRKAVEKGKDSKDSNLRSAYGIIENGIGVIERYKPHPIKFPKTNVVLDFTGFGDDNKAKAFFAELILRQIYAELVSTRDHKPIIIVIDEAHRLFTNGERSSTILKEIAKEGRQARACLWLSTQNYTEIPSKIISNFAFQLLFKTNEQEDLKAVHAIADFLPYVLTTLPDHMFISLRDAENLEHYKIEILYYDWQNEELRIEGKLEIEEIALVRPLKPPLADIEEYKSLILDMVQRKPIYANEVARELGKRYGLELEPAKKIAWNILIGLKNQEESEIDSVPFHLSNRERVDGEFKVKIIVHYYKSGADESTNQTPLHIWEQNWTALEYKRAGYKKIDEARPTDKNFRKPDLIVEKSGKQISVEIETGLKHGKLEDLKERISQSEKEGRETIIIVPNNDIRETYSALFPKALVTCFYPFINSLKGEQVAPERVEEEKETEGEARREGEGGEEEIG